MITKYTMIFQNEIINRLLKDIEPLQDQLIKSITCGLHMVAIEGAKLGFASWSIPHHPVAEDLYPKIPNHITMKELAHWLHDPDPLKASVGMAAYKALIPALASPIWDSIDVGELCLKLATNKNVVVVGHFPFVSSLRSHFETLTVLEKNPQAGDLKSEYAPQVLPKADLVIITATTLTNGTLNEILQSCTKESHKILVGPTTPLTLTLHEFGINFIAGTEVVNAEKLKETIKKGASFRHVQGVKFVIYADESQEMMH